MVENALEDPIIEVFENEVGDCDDGVLGSVHSRGEFEDHVANGEDLELRKFAEELEGRIEGEVTLGFAGILETFNGEASELGEDERPEGGILADGHEVPAVNLERCEGGTVASDHGNRTERIHVLILAIVDVAVQSKPRETGRTVELNELKDGWEG